MPERNTRNTDWRAVDPQGRSPARQLRGRTRIGGLACGWVDLSFRFTGPAPVGACAFTALVQPIVAWRLRALTPWSCYGSRARGQIRFWTVAQRLHDGSRGLQSTDTGTGDSASRSDARKPARSRKLNRRYATTPRWGLTRGLKSTATFKASLCEAATPCPLGVQNVICAHRRAPLKATLGIRRHGEATSVAEASSRKTCARFGHPASSPPPQTTPPCHSA